jgi:hypothetical protein
MRSFVRIGVAASLIAAGAFGTLARVADASVEVRPDVRIYGPTAELVDLGRWAIDRFETAGLEAPPVEIHFHQELSDCGGHLGFARDGRIDLCTTLEDAPARRALLHEIGHIWLDMNTTGSLRDRFLESRGLRSWNASDEPWELRGYEQAAEVLAWGLGERIITPSIPDNDFEQLCGAFEFLTGVAPPPGGWIVS